MIEDILQQNILRMKRDSLIDNYFQMRLYNWAENTRMEIALNYLLVCEELYTLK